MLLGSCQRATQRQPDHLPAMQMRWQWQQGKPGHAATSSSPLLSPPVLVLGGYQECWLQRDFGRHSAFRAQSSCPSDFGTGTVISQDPDWPFSSGVFGVWQVARVGRTIPSWGPNTTFNKTSLLCARMRGLAELGEEQWQGSTEPSGTRRAHGEVAISSRSEGSSPSQDPRRSPWAQGTALLGQRETAQREEGELGERSATKKRRG